MFVRPNILVLGRDAAITIDELLEEAADTDELPPTGHLRFDPPTGELTEVTAAPLSGALITRIIETPAETFIEAGGLPLPGDDGEPFPEGLSLNEIIRDVEAELRSCGLMPGGDAKIDVTWFVIGDQTVFPDEAEQDLVRSATAAGNVLIVSDPGFSSRSAFKETMDFMAGLAGHRLVLSCTVIQPDALVLCSRHTMLERTKSMYLNSRPAMSKAERRAYEAAWAEQYADMVSEGEACRADDISHTLTCAAERAQSILKMNEAAELGNTLGECVSLAGDLYKAIKGEAAPAAMKKKSKANEAKWTHLRVNSLKFNAVCMIYEVAACYGRIVPQHVVKALLGFLPADFQKDAVAVTYALGRVAAALAESPSWRMKAPRALFDEARKEASEIKFDCFDDSMIMRDGDEEIEPDFPDDEFGFDDEFEFDDGTDDGTEDEDDPGSGGDPIEELPEDAFEAVSETVRQCLDEEEKAEANTLSVDNAVCTVFPVLLAPPAAGAVTPGNEPESEPERKPESKPKKAKKSGPGAKNSVAKPAGKKRVK